MTYAGLTTADKGELINAKQAGFAEYGIWVDDVRGWKRMITVNIDLALAQIAEMEMTTNSMTMTWNERINQMTVEEKVLFFAPMLNCTKCKAKQTGVCPFNCRQPLTDFFNSPYTEGEKE